MRIAGGCRIDLDALAQAVQSICPTIKIYQAYSVPKLDWDKIEADKAKMRDAEIAAHPALLAAYSNALAEYNTKASKDRPPFPPIHPGPSPIKSVPRPKPNWLSAALDNQAKQNEE